MPSEQDARAVHVVLTPRGRARYREVLPLAVEEAELGLSALTRAEAAELRRLVARMAEALALPGEGIG